MATPVNLKELMDEMESQTDEARAYVNRETGEIVVSEEDEFGKGMEDAADLYGEEMPEWEDEDAGDGDDEDEPEELIPLPDRLEYDDAQFRERFAEKQEDGAISEQLLAAAQGSGATERFADALTDLNLKDEWRTYREECLRAVAVGWCEDNGLEWE